MSDLIVHYAAQGQHFTMKVPGYTGTRTVAAIDVSNLDTYRDSGWFLPDESTTNLSTPNDGDADISGDKFARVPDEVMHEPPRDKKKKLSFITWTGTAGAWFRCRADYVISESLETPAIIS